MNYLLPILYVMLPFGFLSGGSVHIGQHYAFYIVSGILFGAMFFNGFKSLKNRYAAIFIIYLSILVLLMCSLNQLHILKSIHVKLSMVHLFYFTSAVIVYMSVVSNDLRSEIIYNFICISAMLQATIATFQYFGIYPVVYALSGAMDFKDIDQGGGVTGTIGNIDFLMSYLVISVPFFFRKRWAYCLILIIPMVILSSVSFAMMSLVIGIAVYYNKGIFWIIIAGLLGLLYGFYSDFDKFFNGERITMWRECIKEFKTFINVMIGFGPFSESGKGALLHNEYLSVLHRYGLIGLVIVAGFIRDKIKHFSLFGIITGNKILYSSMVIALVNFTGNPALHFAPTLFLTLMVFGLIEREQRYGRFSDTCKSC